MDAALPGLWSLAPFPALLGVLVWLILSVSRGWLIPRSSHDREVKLLNDMIDRKDETIAAQAAQITSLLEVGQTVQAVLKAAGPDVTGGS